MKHRLQNYIENLYADKDRDVKRQDLQTLSNIAHGTCGEPNVELTPGELKVLGVLMRTVKDIYLEQEKKLDEFREPILRDMMYNWRKNSL